MKIELIIDALNNLANTQLQESYDNVGLIYGDKNWDCTGTIICLDVTEAVLDEAIELKKNLIIAHHPIIFSAIKKISNQHYSERCLIKAIKNDIALFAIHTNFDNISDGVNYALAQKLSLENCKVLAPKKGLLKKINIHAPLEDIENLKKAVFDVGGGKIGNYSNCSFTVMGKGSFMPLQNAKPTLGFINQVSQTEEYKLEIIFPAFLETAIIKAMKKVHSYEEVAYQVFNIENEWQNIGSGLIGTIKKSIKSIDFPKWLTQQLNQNQIKHTCVSFKEEIQTIAICGGAGSFLIKNAILAGADAFITADLKYHEYFEADNKIILADIGHYESEQYCLDILLDYLSQKFTTFAFQKTSINTNPVQYYVQD